jgi:hypothetical protein
VKVLKCPVFLFKRHGPLSSLLLYRIAVIGVVLHSVNLYMTMLGAAGTVADILMLSPFTGFVDD